MSDETTETVAVPEVEQANEVPREDWHPDALGALTVGEELQRREEEQLLAACPEVEDGPHLSAEARQGLERIRFTMDVLGDRFGVRTLPEAIELMKTLRTRR